MRSMKTISRIKLNAIKALFDGLPFITVKRFIDKKSINYPREEKMKLPFMKKKTEERVKAEPVPKRPLEDKRIMSAVSNFQNAYRKKKPDEAYIEETKSEGE